MVKKALYRPDTAEGDAAAELPANVLNDGRPRPQPAENHVVRTYTLARASGARSRHPAGGIESRAVPIPKGRTYANFVCVRSRRAGQGREAQGGGA